MIEKVEEIDIELEIYALRQSSLLVDAEIDFLERRCTQRVAPKVTEMASAGDTVAIPRTRRNAGESTGHLERREIDSKRSTSSAVL